MRILIISSYLPYPLFDGGRIRLYNLMKHLSKKHKITLVCEKRSYQTDKDIAEVKKLCEEVITVDHTSPWMWKNILKTGFSTYPLLLTMHTFPEMKRKIVETLNSKTFDIIHVETFYVFQNVPKTYIPIVLVEHNIEYLVYKRYAEFAPLYLRPLLYIDIKKIQYWEQKFWRKASKVVAVSEDESKLMSRDDVAVVPNGVDIDLFSFRDPEKIFKKKEKKVLFIGDFKWIQNRQSVEWILTEIWPLICSQFDVHGSQLKLWVVGKNIPESLKLLGDQTVMFDENAPKETWKIFQQAAVLLAPIRVGGGTSYKILEAMSSGTPVVTTSLGIEGIAVDKKNGCLIADDAEGLARHVVTLLQNKKQYETIAKTARSSIEKKYNWEVITEKLEKVYKVAALS